MSSSLPPFDLFQFTPYKLAVAAEKLSEGLALVYRRRFGISIPEWRVLVHLTHAGDVSVRDIENQVIMEKSKISRAATRLEAAGYLVKTVNESDRRLVKLALSPKGHDLMGELLPLAVAFQEKIAGIIGEDLEAFEAGLDRLLGDFVP